MSAEHTESSNENIRLRNTKLIEELDIEDLHFLEKDLDFDDKVSMIFLLCGYDKIRAKVAVQQLIIGSYDRNSKTTSYLYDWVQTKCNDWRNMFIEALCIIQANLVLRKLGLNLAELRERFLPHIIETNLFIHPVIKSIYHICEQLNGEQTIHLIEHMKNDYPIANDLEFENYNYLEIFLLHWISESLIELGEWMPWQTNIVSSERHEHCNVEPLLTFLKLHELITLKEQLQQVSVRFNFTSNKLINIGRGSSDSGVSSDCTSSKNNENKKGENKFETDEQQPKIDEKFEERLLSENDKIKLNAELSYVIRRETAGYALIINQEIFDLNTELDKQLEKRYGTNADKLKLIETLDSYGYTILVEDNLSYADIFNKIKDVVNKSSKMDSIIVCILSHGIDGCIYSCDSKTILIKDIEKLLTVRQLLGKPKILIIQACQGKETQKAIKVADQLAHDGPTAPIYSDILVAKSTISGFTSIRHIEEGTWFIQTLCQKIIELSDREHLIDILTIVCNEVSLKRGANNQCMVPWWEMNFRKKFYFPKRI